MRDDKKHNLRGVICLLFDLHSLFCDSRSHHKGWSVISLFRWRLSWVFVVLFLPCKGTLRVSQLSSCYMLAHFISVMAVTTMTEWPTGQTGCDRGLHHPRTRIWSLNSIFFCLFFSWSLRLWIRGSTAQTLENTWIIKVTALLSPTSKSYSPF